MSDKNESQTWLEYKKMYEKTSASLHADFMYEMRSLMDNFGAPTDYDVYDYSLYSIINVVA